MKQEVKKWTLTDHQSGVAHEALAALVNQLPFKLRRRVQMDVMCRAMGQHLMEIDQSGRLCWLAGNYTLLAYFCGRMFSGDHGRFIRRKGTYVWVLGKEPFPAAELNRFFGVNNLKQLRHQRVNLALPECWQLVDSLFAAADAVNRR